MTMTRSEIAIASDWSWVTKRVVAPIRRCSARRSERVRLRSAASRLASGSSRRNSRGSRISARPSATRWRWPPRGGRAGRSRRCEMPSISAVAATRAPRSTVLFPHARREEPGQRRPLRGGELAHDERGGEVFAAGHVRVERIGLEDERRPRGPSAPAPRPSGRRSGSRPRRPARGPRWRAGGSTCRTGRAEDRDELAGSTSKPSRSSATVGAVAAGEIGEGQPAGRRAHPIARLRCRGAGRRGIGGRSRTLCIVYVPHAVTPRCRPFRRHPAPKLASAGRSLRLATVGHAERPRRGGMDRPGAFVHEDGAADPDHVRAPHAASRQLSIHAAGPHRPIPGALPRDRRSGAGPPHGGAVRRQGEGRWRAPQGDPRSGRPRRSITHVPDAEIRARARRTRPIASRALQPSRPARSCAPGARPTARFCRLRGRGARLRGDLPRGARDAPHGVRPRARAGRHRPAPCRRRDHRRGRDRGGGRGCRRGGARDGRAHARNAGGGRRGLCAPLHGRDPRSRRPGRVPEGGDAGRSRALRLRGADDRRGRGARDLRPVVRQDRRLGALVPPPEPSRASFAEASGYDRYPSLFPLARAIGRRLLFLAGPTNSGKTYEAMRLAIEAPTAEVLSPLRLLPTSTARP